MAESESNKELAAQTQAELEVEKKISDVLRACVSTVKRQKDEALATIERLKDI